MIIDTHVHVLTDAIAERTLKTLKATAQIPCYTDMTEADTREKLKGWGIDLGVVLPIATKATQQQTINNWAASIQGGNLICFGTVFPGADDVAEELARIKELGLHGVKLHPDYQNFYADDERIFNVYEELDRLSLPVCFHAGFDPVSPDEIHASPLAIKRVREAFPKLKIIAAHLGGFNLADDVEKYIVGLDIYIDISMSPLFVSVERFERIIKNHGADKVFYASDMPWSHPFDELSMLKQANLSDSEMQGILSENVIRFLNIPAAD